MVVFPLHNQSANNCCDQKFNRFCQNGSKGFYHYYCSKCKNLSQFRADIGALLKAVY